MQRFADVPGTFFGRAGTNVPRGVLIGAPSWWRDIYPLGEVEVSLSPWP